MKRSFQLTILLLIIVMPGLSFGELRKTGLLFEDEIPEWIQPSPPIPLLRPVDESCDNSEHLPPIGDQGSQASCSGWGAGYYYKTYQEWEDTGCDVNDPANQCSPAFIYNQANGGTDGGCYFTDAFKLICDMGCASMEDMPYNENDIHTFPEEHDFISGMSRRCEQYFYISFSTNLTDIKNHLMNGHVAMTGINVWGNFNNISNYNNIYCVSQVTAPNRGGHAITLCGFDDAMITADGRGAFKVANSWGTDWGDNGYFWMSYQAAQSSYVCSGIAYYAEDLRNYEPTLIARFRVSHNDRHALVYQFGIGNHNGPVWQKNFYDWYKQPQAPVPYPATNIVVDLTDAARFINPAGTDFYMRADDLNAYNSIAGTITFFDIQELTVPGSNTSNDPPVAIRDDGSYAFADVNLVLGATGANFSATPRTGTAPLGVWFTDLSTGNPAEWFWDFGDGTTSEEQNPLHTYNEPGDYDVTLTVTDQSGATATRTEVNYITVAAPPIEPLTVNITCNVVNGVPLILLEWEQPENFVVEEYRVYSGANTSFDAIPENLLGVTMDNYFMDSEGEGRRFYMVTVVGNRVE